MALVNKDRVQRQRLKKESDNYASDLIQPSEGRTSLIRIQDNNIKEIENALNNLDSALFSVKGFERFQDEADEIALEISRMDSSLANIKRLISTVLYRGRA